MLTLLYVPDNDQECKDNVREFLEILHDGAVEEGIDIEDEEQQMGNSSQELQNFVYEAVKAFAETNQKAYRESNLVELMNKVVSNRRGHIFEEESFDGQMDMGSSDDED
jgi:hypothetical protein